MANAKAVLIATVAAKGDRAETLKAMRDKLARDMDDAPPAVVAQIAGRLSAVLQELDSLPAREKSTSDDLAGKRAARRAAAKVAQAAPARNVNRKRG